MLSVLIPVYNYNVTKLVTCIHKEAVALGIKFEICILEDGSTLFTDTNHILSNLENVYYKNNRTNLGRTATRQSLAEQATYNRLLFLDADVLPVEKNFLATFLKQDATFPLIIGGTRYVNECPDPSYSLRWKFGVEREAKTVEQREKTPYLSIISQCLFIDKAVFTEVNNNHKDAYGMDIFFSYKLKALKLPILHIDNPIYHMGLETNKVFISKAIRAVDTLLSLENTGEIPPDYSNLQRAFTKIKSFGMVQSTKAVLKNRLSFFEKNLSSEKPKLFYFDLYRLLYYLEHKK